MDIDRATLDLHSTSCVTVLTPAHNEASTITATIASLRAQAWPVDRIIVVCDNCTDDTERIARSLGVEVFTTTDNKDKKSGALNQALDILLPELDDSEFVLVVDADSTLNPEWVKSCMEILLQDKGVGAACGIFVGEPGSGLVGQFQRNEYCQPSGTKLTVLTGHKPTQIPIFETRNIEDIRPGDRVHSVGHSSSFRRWPEVQATEVREFSGELITASIGEIESTYTPDHWCSIKWGDALEDKYVTYLMRKGNHYRIGKSRGYANQGNHPQLGIMCRYNKEKADGIWIIGIHDNEKEAFLAELTYQIQENIPGLLFKANPGTNGITQSELDNLWDLIGNNRDKAEDFLSRKGLDINYPLYGYSSPSSLKLPWTEFYSGRKPNSRYAYVARINRIKENFH